MSPILRRLNKRGLTSDLWAQKLSRELILFTHRQWSYRNSTVNYKPSEGKTVQEHDAINSHVRSLLSLDPFLLPRHHRHLLLQKDLHALNSGTSTSKQFWKAEVTTALAEAALMKKLRKKRYKRSVICVVRNNRTLLVNSVISSLQPPKIPSEPGLKWNKRRHK
jgi:hypothetical protein